MFEGWVVDEFGDEWFVDRCCCSGGIGCGCIDDVGLLCELEVFGGDKWVVYDEWLFVSHLVDRYWMFCWF